MLIWRQYAPLVFLNARVLSAKLRKPAAENEGTRVVLIDATASAGIDSSSATAFIALIKDLEAEGITLWVADVREEGWKLISTAMNAAGMSVPPLYASVADAVARFEQADTAAPGAER